MLLNRIPHSPQLYDGLWIGETQGYLTKRHFWKITGYVNHLLITTSWEDEQSANSFYAMFVPDKSCFQLQGEGDYRIIFLDKDHFVVPNWIKVPTETEELLIFNVLFSRSGLGELTAEMAYKKFLEESSLT